MDIPTIEMERTEAREALLKYRSALKARAEEARTGIDRELAAIDTAVMRGYRELARGNRLLELSKVIALGGASEHEYTYQQWRSGDFVDLKATAFLPRLAATRADARFVFTTGVRPEGRVIYRADDPVTERKADVITTAEDSFAEGERRAMLGGVRARAMVPIIPPPLRPPHKLAGYHLLWEADWTAQAPEDPALLKHLGGDLYALLAVWDLSPLERAVLAGSRG